MTKRESDALHHQRLGYKKETSRFEVAALSELMKGDSER
jgi:hypothetical protein